MSANDPNAVVVAEEPQGQQAVPPAKAPIIGAPAKSPLIDPKAAAIVPAPADAIKYEITTVGVRARFVPIKGTNKVHKYECVEGNNWIDCGEFGTVKLPN